MDTIFALASGTLPSAVAIVRVSGPRSRALAEALTGETLTPRMLKLAEIRDVATGDLIDRGLILYFGAPASFTGEDVVEFQIHGSRAVLRALYRAFEEFGGCRSAKPGEFSRRAFLNSKLDLTAVEGLGDLIESETETQRRQALLALEGGLAKHAKAWRSKIIALQALIEASIDFVDEGESPEFVSADVHRDLADLVAELDNILGDGQRGERIRDGFEVVILGPPNVGKSSLMNALAGRDVAIVSSRAGTTRDLIEVRVDLDGIPVTFVDTAGIRESADDIENEGISRARERATAADLVLWLEEWGMPVPGDREQAYRRCLNVLTKIDQHLDFDGIFRNKDYVAISVVKGLGIDELLSGIRNRLSCYTGGFEPSAVFRARQRVQIQRALDGLKSALQPHLAPELLAENLRLASGSLDGLIGQIATDDVLEEIFSRFCMGK